MEPREKKWIQEACLALQAASVIGARSCTPGDGLNLANHDRLIREARENGWIEEMPEPTNSWTCPCGTEIHRYRGEGDKTCPSCGREFNAVGQELRKGWRDNPSNWDEDVDDLTGYEIAALDREEDTNEQV